MKYALGIIIKCYFAQEKSSQNVLEHQKKKKNLFLFSTSTNQNYKK